MVCEGDLLLSELKHPCWFFFSFFFLNENDDFLTLKVFYASGGKMALDLINLTDKENSVMS